MTAPTPNPDIYKRLVKARTALLIDQPFFGSLSLRLKLQIMSTDMINWFNSKGLRPTLAVNGTEIFYHEPFIESLDMDLLKAAIAHEVGHCVFDHTTRRGQRDPDGWNRAGDYVINDMLKDAGFRLGDGWLYNVAYKGMTTDEIYNQLPKNNKGGGDGDPMDYVFDGATDPAEAAMSQNEWKVAAIQAATAAKAEGKLPASVARFVEQVTETKVDWRERLRAFITEKSKEHYNWSRPNRRYLSAGLYLPSLYSETMGTMVVVSDDSGSIGNEILAVFGGETAAIRSAVRPELTIVMSCDAAVNHVDELGPDDDLKLENHGGGGTDFRPPFEWLEERGIKPACLVYLTDMYGTFPKQPPEYPVLWCAITDVKAPWGETIKIEV